MRAHRSTIISAAAIATIEQTPTAQFVTIGVVIEATSCKSFSIASYASPTDFTTTDIASIIARIISYALQTSLNIIAYT